MKSLNRMFPGNYRAPAGEILSASWLFRSLTPSPNVQESGFANLDGNRRAVGMLNGRSARQKTKVSKYGGEERMPPVTKLPPYHTRSLFWGAQRSLAALHSGFSVDYGGIGTLGVLDVDRCKQQFHVKTHTNKHMGAVSQCVKPWARMNPVAHSTGQLMRNRTPDPGLVS